MCGQSQTQTLPQPVYTVGRSSLLALFLRFLLTLQTWHDRSRQRQRLSQLDEHLRRDIGLTRADIERETAKAFWEA